MSSIIYGGHYSSTPTPNFGYATTSICNGSLVKRFLLDGVITAIKVNCSSPGPECAGVRVWRDTDADSADCKLIGSPARLSTIKNASGGTTLINGGMAYLDNPITVLMGDAGGIEYSGGTAKLAYTGSLSSRYSLAVASSKVTDGTWINGDGGGNANPYTELEWCVEFYGRPAQLVTYGDSISFGSSGDATHFASSLESEFWSTGHRDARYSLASLLRASLGLTSCMNCGRGSMDILWGVNNFLSRVDPYAAEQALIICNFGVNDLTGVVNGVSDQWMTLEQHKGYWSDLLDLVQAIGGVLIRQSICHVATGYSAADADDVTQYAPYWNAKIDEWNAGMDEWCTDNSVPNSNVDKSGSTDLATANLIGNGADDFIHPQLGGYTAIVNNLTGDIGLYEPTLSIIREGIRYRGSVGILQPANGIMKGPFG